jgi:dimethylamine monooxygenase subunit A
MRPLPAEAVHISFEPAPYRMAMGLTACPWSEWLELDDRYVPEMAERRELLAKQRNEVLVSVPGSEVACRETLDRLGAHLPEQYPDWFVRNGRLLENRLTGEIWDVVQPPCGPLALAARLVQEDLCIIQLEGGVPVLTAGVVCFPSRWRLLDKIARPLADVHGPVPLYQERLARPVDRFMAMVRPGHVAARFNWSVLDNPALFQCGGKFRSDHSSAVTADNAAERLFVRVERQTLSRLPASGAVLFTIRVHVYPLQRITVPVEIAARLAEAVRVLPEETAHYKSLLRFRAALLEYLDRRVAAG